MFLGQPLSLTFYNFLECRRGRAAVCQFPYFLFQDCFLLPVWETPIGLPLKKGPVTRLPLPRMVREGMNSQVMKCLLTFNGHHAYLFMWVPSFNLSGAP